MATELARTCVLEYVSEMCVCQRLVVRWLPMPRWHPIANLLWATEIEHDDDDDPVNKWCEIGLRRIAVQRRARQSVNERRGKGFRQGKRARCIGLS